MTIRRIVLSGPESTGKTTLARELADALRAPVTEEAARLYAEWHPGPLPWTAAEPIAQLAIRLEDDAIAEHALGGTALLILDSDLVSTVVYSRHYYGLAIPWIEAAASARRGDLYLLCAPDLPWEADGVRDRPAQREAMFEAFARELARIDANVVVIRGSGLARFESALEAIVEWRVRESAAPTTPSPGRGE